MQHDIISIKFHSGRETRVTDRKQNKKQMMGRILALVIAGVMTLSVVLAVLLK